MCYEDETENYYELLDKQFEEEPLLNPMEWLFVDLSVSIFD